MRIGLGVNRDYVTKAAADAIGIVLSEPQGLVAVSWQLDIFASLEVGEFQVGTLFTSPGINGNTAGLSTNRIIGHAVCPGARAWKIRATGPTAAQTATAGQPGGQNISAALDAIPVQGGASAFGLGSGVFYAQGRVVLNGGAATSPMTVARGEWANTFLLSNITAYNPGSNAAEQWVMAFDKSSLTAAPVPGTQPDFGFALDLPAGATGQLNLSPPQHYVNGLWLMVSTTPDTLTAAGAQNCRILTTAWV